jgi:hypothetical protein
MRPMAQFIAYSLFRLAPVFLACSVQDISFPISRSSHGSSVRVSQKSCLAKSFRSRPSSPSRLGPSRRGRYRSHRKGGCLYRWERVVTPCMRWKRLAPSRLSHWSSPSLTFSSRSLLRSPAAAPAGPLSPASRSARCHQAPEILKSCDGNRIQVLTFPPHSSDQLHPFDLLTFGFLKCRFASSKFDQYTSP